MIDRYASEAMIECWSPARRLADLMHAAVIAAEVTDSEFGTDLTPGVRGVMGTYLADLRVGHADQWLGRWAQLELKLDHDIAAFVELVRERLGSQREYFHLGRTSSDLSDTALAFAVRRSQVLVSTALDGLITATAEVALEHRTTHIVGRTHGQPAEMTTVGRRFAVAAADLAASHLEPYTAAKMTGPVGVNSHLASQRALDRAGLRQSASTQIVPRSALVETLAEITVLTVPVSNLAALIRLGARPDGWCKEGRRGDDSRGSSSMPTKRNPIRSEKVAGLCTYIRSGVAGATEAMSGLWEERDISHSSVERLALPDIFAATEHVLTTMTEVVSRLEVAVPESDGLQVTPAVQLAHAVRHGASYHAAYEHVRAGVLVGNPDPVPYDPSSEPELWRFIRMVAG